MFDLNIAVSLTGVILCALSLLLIRGIAVKRRTVLYGRLFYIFLSLFAFSNLIGLIFRGIPGIPARIVLYVSNFCEFLAPDLLALTVIFYLLHIVDPEGKRKTFRVVQIILMILDITLLVISQFTGLFYVIDAQNIYRRQPMYPVSYIFTGIGIAMGIYLLVAERKRLTPREEEAMWIYFLVPLAAALIQIRIYGVNIVILSTVIAGLVMYLHILNDQTERYIRQERENTELRIRILQSQIQPHFLFNSLATIRELCRIDPGEAERATGLLSQFLRHNMAYLSSDSMIPFEQELGHTKAYLELQSIRFGEDLQIRYEIECTDFMLPSLTLQPLVENAVSHGIRKNPDGRGTVTIRTAEYQDRYEVSVIDNGPGFDVEKTGFGTEIAPVPLEPDEHTHIGLKNIRSRLMQLCGGKLKIISSPEKGTDASIVIYKNRLKESNDKRR